MINSKIKLVSIESGIGAIGFRKIAAIARSIVPSTEICFIPTDNLYSFSTHLFPDNKSLNDEDIKQIALYLSNADFIGFSSMTASSKYVEKISEKIKIIKPNTYIFWGGVHPTLYSEEAISFVDAICIGEGEVPIRQMMEKLVKGQPLSDVPNMWFQGNSEIFKNELIPLNTSEFLNKMPHSYNGDDCIIYDIKNKAFRPFKKIDYAAFNGLAFRTTWTLGCPYSCSYCANDSFIKLDRGYRELRHTSVDYLIEEIKLARAKFPFISTIAFHDDNLIALPTPILEEFSKKYKQEINLPFVVFGMSPNLITKEKVELLVLSGMNRARMGIQSGSRDTLKFYNRPTTKVKIIQSSTVLADAAIKHKLIPPSYDIISDNPVETCEDVIETLDMLYNIKRPFTLTIFSLRIFPKTKLDDYFQKNLLLAEYFKSSSYLDTRKNIINITLYLLAIFKPPRFLFSLLLSKVKKEFKVKKEYPIIYNFVRFTYLAKRAMEHLVKFDFSTMVGKWTYYMWKIKNILPNK